MTILRGSAVGRLALVGSLLAGCSTLGSLSWSTSTGSGTGSAATESPSSAGPAAATGPDRSAAWKRFTLKDVTLGSELGKLVGFTCEASPGKYRYTCVQFPDVRCQGKATKIKSVGTTAEIPNGQSCFMDSSNGGTYLDRVFQSPPLSAVWVIGTDTSPPKVYEINFTFARDVLTDDSKLGKALLAKYGKPDFTNGDFQWAWNFGSDMMLSANCGATQGPTGDYCSLKVYDQTVLDTERSIQKARDEERAKKEAPAAPAL